MKSTQVKTLVDFTKFQQCGKQEKRDIHSHTVWKNEKFTLTEEKFRQIN